VATGLKSSRFSLGLLTEWKRHAKPGIRLTDPILGFARKECCRHSRDAGETRAVNAPKSMLQVLRYSTPWEGFHKDHRCTVFAHWKKQMRCRSECEVFRQQGEKNPHSHAPLWQEAWAGRKKQHFIYLSEITAIDICQTASSSCWGIENKKKGERIEAKRRMNIFVFVFQRGFETCPTCFKVAHSDLSTIYTYVTGLVMLIDCWADNGICTSDGVAKRCESFGAKVKTDSKQPATET